MIHRRTSRSLAPLVFLAAAGCSTTRCTLALVVPAGPRFLVAHRGGHLAAPENSLESIREAGRLGATYAEVDVRTTADDELVIMHDISVDRTTDGSGEVPDLSLAKLRTLILERPIGVPSDEHVPTFAEALDAAARAHVSLYVDVKNVTPERLARALAHVAPGLVLVYQDDFEWLDRFHALAPSVPLLPECESADEIREAARRWSARAFASTIRHFEREHAAAAHAVGGVIVVDVLGLDDDVEARAEKAFRRGADAVQTDDPARLHPLVASAPEHTRP